MTKFKLELIWDKNYFSPYIIRTFRLYNTNELHNPHIKDTYAWEEVYDNLYSNIYAKNYIK